MSLLLFFYLPVFLLSLASRPAVRAVLLPLYLLLCLPACSRWHIHWTYIHTLHVIKYFINTSLYLLVDWNKMLCSFASFVDVINAMDTAVWGVQGLLGSCRLYIVSMWGDILKSQPCSLQYKCFKMQDLLIQSQSFVQTAVTSTSVIFSAARYKT